MGVYKDKSTDTWYCKFYYKDWKGERHQTTKRGFRTKKDASLWEAEFKLSKTRSLHISFETFVEMYFEDKKNKLKERSIYSKRYMIARHILPYFENIKVDEVKPADIIQWQNAMKEKNYSETYLRMVQNQLTALYTHATRVYGLRDNPCSHVDKIGKSDAKHVDFWTKEEYERFIAVVDKDDKYYVLFELLFWCGIRIGEALALTYDDFDFERKALHITKTYYRLKKKDIISSPKTENSVRTISMPDFLLKEVKDYYERLYQYPTDARLFEVVPKAVENKFKRATEKAGLKRIRIHDLRHSHASYLIEQGVDATIIKERLGHNDIKITLNTYGHLYPNRQRELAAMLDMNRKELNS